LEEIEIVTKINYRLFCIYFIHILEVSFPYKCNCIPVLYHLIQFRSNSQCFQYFLKHCFPHKKVLITYTTGPYWEVRSVVYRLSIVHLTETPRKPWTMEGNNVNDVDTYNYMCWDLFTPCCVLFNSLALVWYDMLSWYVNSNGCTM
jgi:hypothetical protein